MLPLLRYAYVAGEPLTPDLLALWGKVNRFIELCDACVVVLWPSTAFYSLLQHELTRLLSPTTP